MTSSFKKVEASAAFFALAAWKKTRTPRNGMALLELPCHGGTGHSVSLSASLALRSGVDHGPEIMYGDLPPAKLSLAMS